MSTQVIWPKLKPEVEFQYGGRLGEVNGMSSQSHLPHYRVLPRGEFNVMIPELRVTLQGAATWRIHWHVIPEPRVTLQGRPTATWWIHCHDPHATLQGAVTWRNQCHDRATLQGVRIPSAILKIVFRHILCIFVFLMLFGLWRAAAFVSSPIHLFVSLLVCLSVAKMQKTRFSQKLSHLELYGIYWQPT